MTISLCKLPLLYWDMFLEYLTYPEILSWRSVGFCQRPFLNLMMWTCGFYVLDGELHFTPMFWYFWYSKVLFQLPKQKEKTQANHKPVNLQSCPGDKNTRTAVAQSFWELPINVLLDLRSIPPDGSHISHCLGDQNWRLCSSETEGKTQCQF